MSICKANDFRTRSSDQLLFQTYSELYDRNQGSRLNVQNNQIEQFQDCYIYILKTAMFIFFSRQCIKDKFPLVIIFRIISMINCFKMLFFVTFRLSNECKHQLSWPSFKILGKTNKFCSHKSFRVGGSFPVMLKYLALDYFRK